MMMWDKKKALQTIMNRKREAGAVTSGPTEMANESVKAEDGSPDMKHLAAREVMEAFHSKSPEKFNESMSNFIDLHMHAGANNKPEPHE